MTVSEDLEIEIRISLNKSTFLKVKEKVKETAKFTKSSKQIDQYFTPAHRNFVEPKFPFEWLSIRKRGSKIILNYKHFYPENVGLTTHCDEFETEIKKADQLQKIFSALNLKSLVTVEKTREVYVYNNELEVSLDKVKELGYFIEIEAVKDFGGVEATRKKLFEFAKNIGIDTLKTDKRGYPYLLMKKKELI